MLRGVGGNFFRYIVMDGDNGTIQICIKGSFGHIADVAMGAAAAGDPVFGLPDFRVDGG